MASHTILVGNGPNRLRTDSHSWQRVLLDLADHCGVADPLARLKGKPFTLFFEELLLRASASGYSEAELRRQVVTSMRQLEPNDVHRELMGIAGRHVLTTNYDYSLEQAAGVGNGNRADMGSETRYSLFRCREAGKTRVWHLHGELDRPDTVTLGYDQYVGHLDKMRGYVSLQPPAPGEQRSPMIEQMYEFEERTDRVYSWVDVFLRDDVHIVGFSFDYSEIDLWWLLSLKERMRQNNRRVAKGVQVGRTVFHYFRGPRVSSAQAALLSALESFGAQCVATTIRDKRYDKGWDHLLDNLDSIVSTS